MTKHILVAEDFHPFQELTIMHLEKAGYTVTAVNTPEETEALIQEGSNFDLLLVSDNAEWQVRAVRLLEHVRDTPGYAEVPFLLLAGHIDVDTGSVRATVERLGGEFYEWQGMVSSRMLPCVAVALGTQNASDIF